MIWKTSKRELILARPLVMAVLNLTPDSFSDGGKFADLESALKQAEKLVSEGADILDIGGESTRPGSQRTTVDEEIRRVVPVIAAVGKRFGTPVSIDTTKAEVADAAVQAGAEIINDISALRFDPEIANVAAKRNSGIILMHSRGKFETMHSQPPVENIMAKVAEDFRRSIAAAQMSGIGPDHIALDVGIGFGKTLSQNLELLAKLDVIAAEFAQCPIVVGTSRKSFIGKILDEASPTERLSGSIATAAIAVWNGAKIIRAHDVKETLEAVRMAEAIKREVCGDAAIKGKSK